jgi:hypothetical protein
MRMRFILRQPGFLCRTREEAIEVGTVDAARFLRYENKLGRMAAAFG